MAAFRVVPIDREVAEQVRSTLRSPQYGHPAHVEVSAGYGPCRSCLKTFEEGKEERILFTYNPFEGLDAYPSPGPIFVHAQACEPFGKAGSFPERLRALPLTLEGYAEGRWVVARLRPEHGQEEDAIAKLFAHVNVDYIHIRNTEAGCYIARVERARESR